MRTSGAALSTRAPGTTMISVTTPARGARSRASLPCSSTPLASSSARRARAMAEASKARACVACQRLAAMMPSSYSALSRASDWRARRA